MARARPNRVTRWIMRHRATRLAVTTVILWPVALLLSLPTMWVQAWNLTPAERRRYRRG